MTQPYSLYFHIPFCTHRCAYCDFNTYAGQEDSIPAYVDALCKEIEFVGTPLQLPPSRERGMGEVPRAKRVGERAHTVFFGGGTPSLLSPAQFDSIFKAIRANFDLLDDAENTIEANPGTVSGVDLSRLREIGINRISFGVQSANGEELRMLERTHTFFDVIEAISAARRAGFDNLNLDLIYGLPEQTLETWQITVKRILDLHPEHISAYALTLEHGTPFGRWSAHGLLPLPDPDLAAEMYEWASETLEANGYVQYEISNWAKDSASSGAKRSRDASSPAYACRHNLQYWRGLPYLGFGAGAHGYAAGYRYSNVLRIKTYVERMNDIRYSNIESRISNIDSRISNLEFPLSPTTVNQHRQSTQDDMSEFMMTGLRLTREGIAAPAFSQRFGRELLDVYSKEVTDLTSVGLLEWSDDNLRLTKRGRLLGNQVFMQFVE